MSHSRREIRKIAGTNRRWRPASLSQGWIQRLAINFDPPAALAPMSERALLLWLFFYTLDPPAADFRSSETSCGALIGSARNKRTLLHIEFKNA